MLHFAWGFKGSRHTSHSDSSNRIKLPFCGFLSPKHPCCGLNISKWLQNVKQALWEIFRAPASRQTNKKHLLYERHCVWGTLRKQTVRFPVTCECERGGLHGYRKSMLVGLDVRLCTLDARPSSIPASGPYHVLACLRRLRESKRLSRHKTPIHAVLLSIHGHFHPSNLAVAASGHDEDSVPMCPPRIHGAKPSP